MPNTNVPPYSGLMGKMTLAHVTAAGRIPKPRRGAIVTAAAMTAMLSGCAFTYTDGTGARHAIGLLDVAVKAPRDRATLAGDVIEVTSLGVSIGQTGQGGYITAGYNHEVTATLRDNAMVLGNPVTALSAVSPRR